MNITLKLFATLVAHLPAADRPSRQTRVVAPEDITVLGLILQAGLPLEHCTLVLRNGTFVHREALAAEPLEEGDVVAIWPPVGGG